MKPVRTRYEILTQLENGYVSYIVIYKLAELHQHQCRIFLHAVMVRCQHCANCT